jgi:hypothetical protein
MGNGQGMRKNNPLRLESRTSAAFLALLRFEADACRLRAWLLHAYELLDSDMPLAADNAGCANLAGKLIDIYDNKGALP